MMSVEQDLFRRAPAAFVLFAPDGTILAHNPILLEWVRAPKDIPQDALIGTNILEWLTPEHREIYHSKLLPELRREGIVREGIIEAYDFEGNQRPIFLNADIATMEDGSERIYCVMMDAELRISFERKLLAEKERADDAHARLSLLQQATGRLALATSLEDLGTTLAQAAHDTTQAYWSLVELIDRQSGAGRARKFWGSSPLPLDLLSEQLLPSTPLICQTPEAIKLQLPELAPQLTEQGIRSLVVLPITGPEEQGHPVIGAIHCWCARDRDFEHEILESLQALVAQADQLIEHIRLQDEVRHSAMHDALTGLPNMRLIEEKLERLPEEALRSGQSCAVLYLDLDGFKSINDAHGHTVGDAALQTISARLRRTCRANEMVGRIGGDEFVIIVEDIDVAGLTELASRVLRVASEPLEGDATGSSMSTSIGAIIWNPVTGSTPPTATELLTAADEAMYEAKRSGKDAFVLREWGTSKAMN